MKKANMMKVQVNAQVTAIVSLFEFLGNVFHLFLLVYFKGTTFVSLFHAISLYFIVLPYAFLMNTSENKNRLAEQGWANVFKNLLGQPHGATQVDKNLVVKDASLRCRTNKVITASTDKDYKDITITRQSGNGEQLSSYDENSIPNVPSSDEPSCSNLSSGQGSKGQRFTSQQTLDVKTLVQNVNEHPLAKKQIKEAITNVKDEKKYLEHFKKLVALQEFCKGGTAVSELCLENEFKTSILVHDESVNKKSNKKGKRHEDNISILFKESKFNECTIEASSSRDEQAVEEDLDERSKIRNSILLQLDSFYDDTERFESLIEQLISYEESFL